MEAVMEASRALYADGRVPHTVEDAELLRLLGVASSGIPGSPGQARATAARYFEEALALTPRDPRLLANLGQIAADDGEHPRARDLFERALAEDPADARAIRGLARALAELGESERALAILATSAEPKSELLRAQLLLRFGRYRDALDVLGDPGSDPARIVLVGGALYELGAHVEACALLERGYAAGDRTPALLLRLAAVREAVGDLARARALCREAEALPSGAPGAGRDLKVLRAKLAFAAGRVELAVDTLRALASSDSELSVHDASTLLFFASHDARVRGPELFALHRAWAERAQTLAGTPLAGVSAEPPTPRVRASSDRLRVGYLSPDFREHVVMRFLRPVLEAHTAHGMDVVLLSIADHADPVSLELRARFPFVDLTRVSDADARELIRKESLDVVVDLAGHSSTPRLGILTERTAPLVATYLGYPGTTGLSTVDLRITDADADPPETQRDFSERLAPLGRCAWAYVPRELYALASRLPGSRRFGSFNRLCKGSNVQLELFARVLLANPDAELLLRARGLSDPEVKDGLADLFRLRGVLDRVVFSDWAPSYAESLEDYRTVDVALDTFPYAGTTTTCDALLMGVPVVTLVGDTPASRPGRSLLRAVGLDDLVTETPDAYVERATRALRERHLHDREALRARFLGGPLGDPAGLAGALRALYERELAAHPRSVRL
jgi:protein O-GlcNAc transferase